MEHAHVVSPIGRPVEEDVRERLENDPEFRAEWERTWPYEVIARAIIFRRAELGLTQKELAERMGTSHSAISRIERGSHPTTLRTLLRLADALEMRLAVTLEPKEGSPAGVRRRASAG